MNNFQVGDVLFNKKYQMFIVVVVFKEKYLLFDNDSDYYYHSSSKDIHVNFVLITDIFRGEVK